MPCHVYVCQGNGKYTGVQGTAPAEIDNAHLTKELAVMKKVMSLYIDKDCEMTPEQLKRARLAFRGGASEEGK